MLRELSSLLIELHEGLLAIEARELGAGPGVTLSEVEMRLPLTLRPVFEHGGCRLLADYAHSSGMDDWTPQASQLHLHWSRSGSAAEEAAP